MKRAEVFVEMSLRLNGYKTKLTLPPAFVASRDQAGCLEPLGKASHSKFLRDWRKRKKRFEERLLHDTSRIYAWCLKQAPRSLSTKCRHHASPWWLRHPSCSRTSWAFSAVGMSSLSSWEIQAAQAPAALKPSEGRGGHLVSME